MKTAFFSAIFCTMLLAAGAGAIAADDSEATQFSNKWRIETSGGAKSSGELVFRVTQHQGAPVDVTVAIEKGRAENNIARDIRDALQAQLSPARYTVETDDGEDILVKLPDGQPNFSLELVKSSVENVSVEVERE